MSLAPFVRIVAQGKGRARSLTMPEAQEAMTIILAGNAAPEAVGALLMVLRLRGETDEEIAGFTAALRCSVVANLPAADLDWPCYAAGRTRGAPLFLLSAKLVANAGYKVAMHGWNSHQAGDAGLRDACDKLDVLGGGLSYVRLEDLNSKAFDLLRLRDTFGLRSCFNTVLRMWNPSAAGASVQGVFHPSYRGLQSRAAALLGDSSLTVIKGGGGEFERNPTKDTSVFGLRAGVELNDMAVATTKGARKLHEPDAPIDLAAFWRGANDDAFATATVIGTAALALWTLGAASTIRQAEAQASALWYDRHQPKRNAV